MHKTPVQMFYVCPTHLTTMKCPLGLPTSLFRIVLRIMQDRYGPTQLHSNVLFFGTSYNVTFNSNSSTAPLHKRVRTAYLAASKTSDAPSVATCAKTTEAVSSYEHYPFHVRMELLTKTRR